MSGFPKKTNLALLCITIILCLLCGAVLTRSSANPSPLSEELTPDMVLVKNSTSEENSVDKEDTSQEPSPTAEPTPTNTPTPTPKITVEPEKEKIKDYTPSKEASLGVWTANGSQWLFLIDGIPHYGWLYDTDEKVYYFNGSGIMVTGWQDIGSKRYFFNLDGVLQTGDILYEGETYHLLEDGSLEGYEVKKNKKQKKSSKNNSSNDSASVKENKETKYVALTFDDGPSSFTNRLLDCLETNHAKATFFLVGYEITSFQNEILRMEELGMEIGNHSADHKDLSKLDIENIQDQILSVDDQIKELTGHSAQAVRPPYGAVNSTVKSTISQPLILWSIDTLDWESQDPDAIVQTVLSEVENGSIILMHDIYSTTVDAVELLIPQLLSQGYELLTVHELAEKFNISLEAGKTYSSFSNSN